MSRHGSLPHTLAPVREQLGYRDKPYRASGLPPCFCGEFRKGTVKRDFAFGYYSGTLGLELVMSRNIRLPILLAAAAMLLNGCMTTRVWEQKAFHVPAPEPQLKLSVAGASGDTLVEYQELNERSGQ